MYHGEIVYRNGKVVGDIRAASYGTLQPCARVRVCSFFFSAVLFFARSLTANPHMATPCTLVWQFL